MDKSKNSNNNSNSNNNNIESINENINRQKEIFRAQQKQQRDNMKNLKKRQEQDTMFDFVLQWGSLACSKLLFFPVEFPIHALTTFIQSQPTPQQPSTIIINSNIAPSPPIHVGTLLSQFTTNISSSSFVENLPVPVSTSLINLLRQKGMHIYDGGMVYIVHNMVTILINFIQRSADNYQNSPKYLNKIKLNSEANTLFNRIGSKNISKGISASLSLLKYALTLPLDVIMTRLIVHKFYRSNNTSNGSNNLNDCTFSGVCKNEGIRALYTGWEVIVLKSLLEAVYTKLDTLLKNNYSKRNNQSYQQQQQQQQQSDQKSPLQIALLGVKILLDYILTVVKVRLNIRNIGLLKTLRNIISRQGIRGLFSGLNTYFMLFPLWMISILVANIIFIKIKNTLDKSEIPPPPKLSSSPKPSKISSPSTYDEDVADAGLGVAMISDISSQVSDDGEDNSNNNNNSNLNNNINNSNSIQNSSDEEEEEKEEEIVYENNEDKNIKEQKNHQGDES